MITNQLNSGSSTSVNRTNDDHISNHTNHTVLRGRRFRAMCYNNLPFSPKDEDQRNRADSSPHPPKLDKN